MNQSPTASDHINSLIKEQTDLLANKMRLTDQISAVSDRLKIVDAALDGARLGQQVAQDAAAERAAAVAAAEAAKAEPETPTEE